MKSKDIEQNSKVNNIKTIPIDSAQDCKKYQHANTQIYQQQINHSCIESNKHFSVPNYYKSFQTQNIQLYLPLRVKTVRDQLLVEKEIIEKVYQFEDSTEWFKGILIMQLKFGYCKYYKKKQYYYEDIFVVDSNLEKV
ncbi:unnamed protein product (macronuclear) [Paramecium tetraurelia]|uniref:Uncharacterized protein n=1 Tax=Paramecium tetraurelia TaxID=5888 RepID=A0DR83_PARTE|nr:uncharacterized protein GSPATT00019267001 [Paramecium tetraurelia]CAK85550.1 unnamed protein product [Paramecium tetraurelia]|eukprot:XP_001452947.1 hypothetical protein (macronuclear) [Paramecium tetraurelia strain d4-2]